MESFLTITVSIMALISASVMIVVRSRASKRPTSPKKIILPPLFMSTGAFMFFIPYFRLSWVLVLESLLVGMLFSILLIITTRFEIKGEDIYIKPSKAFVFILIFLLIVRISLKYVLGQEIDLGELSGMFYLLAFGMLLTWRMAMLVKYNKLKAQTTVST